MKILQVLPELNSGGVERGTVELAQFLIKEGHESLVLSNGGRLVAQLENEGTRHLTHPVHKKSLLSLRHISYLKKLLQEEQPDILHLRSRAPAWLCYLAWSQLPKNSRPHLVTTVHGTYSVNSYSKIMTKGERVICVSESVQDYVLKNYPKTPPEKLTIIHRGVDSFRYHPDYKPSPDWQENWRNNYPQFTGKTLLLLPGRITRWKGHQDFLLVLQQLLEDHPHLHGVIAGAPSPGKEGYLAELKDTVRAMGLESNLTFLGHRSDLRDVIAACDITLSLSKDPEAFGRVSLEAMSLGKPVAAYAHGGVAEQLKALFPAGAVTPNEPKEIIALVNTWLTNSLPSPALNNSFTLAHMNSQILEVYQSLTQ
ncbi:MAG: glycosyltransferase [Roseibacillus sp.]